MKALNVLVFFISVILIGEMKMDAGYDGPVYVPISHSIRAKVAPKLAKKHQMDLVGTSASMMDCVKMTGMSYKRFKSIDQAEARRLIVDCVEEYLALINTSKNIRPYLQNFPATSKNINITIYNLNPDHSPIFDPLVSVVSCARGVIVYRTKDSENKNGYKSIIEEPYGEALEIVRHEGHKPVL